MPGWTYWLPALALSGVLGAADVPAAEANLRRVEALVDAGAAPRSALQAARKQLQDARNDHILQQTLYSGNVAPEQTSEMLRAATELRASAAEALAAQQKLLAEGVLAPKALERWRQDLALAEQQLELAHSRAKLVAELAEMAGREAEWEALAELELAVRFAGKGALSERDFAGIESAFQSQFARSLPVSARGATAVHRSMGFNHRERFDVALNPDQEEGRWLIHLLKRLQVPYIAFRRAATGRSTGAHIHIGPPSPPR